MNDKLKCAIEDCLNNRNVDGLMELVPTLSMEEACYYIEKWQQLCSEVIVRGKSGKDASDIFEKKNGILNALISRNKVETHGRTR